jgi:hypothetical protein
MESSNQKKKRQGVLMRQEESITQSQTRDSEDQKVAATFS